MGIIWQMVKPKNKNPQFYRAFWTQNSTLSFSFECPTFLSEIIFESNFWFAKHRNSQSFMINCKHICQRSFHCDWFSMPKFYSFNWFYGTNIIKSIWGKASIKEYGHCFLESKLIKNRPLLLSPVSHFKWVFNSLYLFIIFVFIPICRKWTPSHGFRFYFSFTGWKDRCEFLLSGQKIDKLT